MPQAIYDTRHTMAKTHAGQATRSYGAGMPMAGLPRSLPFAPWVRCFLAQDSCADSSLAQALSYPSHLNNSPATGESFCRTRPLHVEQVGKHSMRLLRRIPQTVTTNYPHA